jgi:hypothetical protein
VGLARQKRKLGPAGQPDRLLDQFLLRAVVAEEADLIDRGALGNAPGRGSAIACLGEERGGGSEDALSWDSWVG